MKTDNKNKQQNVKYILDNLRKEDEKELKASHGYKWKEKVFKNIIACTDINIAVSQTTNKPVLMWGICEELVKPKTLGSAFDDYKKIGIIWLLSTPEIQDKSICFLKNAKKQIKIYEKNFDFMCNKVHIENKTAINWLKWLGFKIEPFTEKFMFFYKGNY